MKIIHLTDPHFVPEGKTLYGRDPSVALAAAVADINAHHADAHLVVMTGDLTHWGEPEAFDHLARVLSPLRPPLRLLVGNHDNREIFRAHFPDQASDTNGFVQASLQTPVGQFLFLDTTLEGTHAGHYCADRLSWLLDNLENGAGTPLFLFMHHPPFDIGLRSMDMLGLVQKDAFREVIEPHKSRIRHLFFGHVHRPVAGSWLGIPVSTVRALNHQVGFDLESEAIPGSFEPPAYGVVLINDEAIAVHMHDFMDGSPKFQLSDSPWDDWARRSPHP